MKSKLLAHVLAAVCILLATMERISAQSWESTTNIYNNWNSVAMSSDGSMIAADSFIAGIYTSTDGGTNWENLGSPEYNHWSVLAASTNGGNLVAAFYGGGIYTSANWGASWQPSAAPIDQWNCLASSWDGTRLVAGTSPGVIYTSKDSGATFTSRLPQNNGYQAIAGSANGGNLVAVVLGGKIYRSTDLGETWAATTAPSGNWSSVAASTDGVNLAAAIQGGGIFTSADSGISWTITSAPNTNWESIASSANGSRLVAAVNGGLSFGGGLIYISADSGATWAPTTAPSNYWATVYSSPDGANLLALANGGSGNYFSTNSGSTWSEQYIDDQPGSTNVFYTDAFNLSIICSNLNSHALTTNVFNTVVNIPASAITSQSVIITNTVGINWAKMTIAGTNVLSVTALLGVNEQGNNVFGISPIKTDLLGTNVLGIGASFAQTGETNSVVAKFTIPAGIGSVNTNSINIFSAKVSGISVIISNALNIQGTTGGSPLQSWSAITGSSDGRHLAAAINGGLIYNSTNSGATWTTNAGLIGVYSTTSWAGVIASTNGLNQAAAIQGGGIYTSANSGASWTVTGAPSTNWSAITVTDGGSLLLAAVNGGLIYLSTDSGAIWGATTAPSNYWTAVYSSSDGAHLVAAANGGGIVGGSIYYSTNSGSNWAVASAPSTNWYSLNGSADGTQLIAAVNGGLTYSSTNFGVTWTTNSSSIGVYPTSNPGVQWTTNIISISSPTRYWSALASSADGTKLVATVANGGIFTSSDSGTTWVSNNVPWQVMDGEDFQSSSSFTSSNYSTWATSGQIWTSNGVPNQNWSAVYSSADGNTLVALARYGWSFKSTNGGAAWFGMSTPYDFWQSVASSADGSRLLAASAGGYVYLSTNAGTSWNELVITPGGTNLVSTDTFFFSATYTNWNKTTANTNDFKTDAFGPFVSIPNLVISTNVVSIADAVGLNLFGIAATATNIVETNSASATNYTYGTNVLIATLGVNQQGSNVFGVSSVSTDILGNLGLSKNITVIPNSAFSNVVAAGFTIPDGTGLFNTNGIFSTNLVSILTPDASGINLLISNVLNINVVIINGVQTWSSVAMSADGTRLGAAVNGGGIYTSTNSGITWSVTDAPDTNWSALALSSDGYTLVAFSTNGLLEVSSDFGVTWAATNLPASTRCSVAVSANGSELLAVMYPGYIYSAQTTPVVHVSNGPAPALTIAAVDGNIILSWPTGPTNWILQERPGLSAASSWADVSTVPIVTNGENQVTLPLSSNLRFYRLRD